jgi:hypothetical protein
VREHHDCKSVLTQAVRISGSRHGFDDNSQAIAIKRDAVTPCVGGQVLVIVAILENVLVWRAYYICVADFAALTSGGKIGRIPDQRLFCGLHERLQ